MATLASSNARSSNARGSRNSNRSSNTRTRSNSRQQRQSAPQNDERPIAMRVTGAISDYFKGTTKNGQPYVRAKFDGQTNNGKAVKGTVMAFGEKNIGNLDINARTKEAGLFVIWDGGVLAPVGPYMTDEQLSR